MRFWMRRRIGSAQRYERSEARRDTRRLQTKASEVQLKVPKLRRQTLETAIIERYRLRESSIKEALIKMYLAGISVPRVPVTDARYQRNFRVAAHAPQSFKTARGWGL